MIEQFWDGEGRGFYFTGHDHEALIACGMDPYDTATPAATSVAVTALLRLVKLTGRADLLDKAEATLKLYAGLMQTRPFTSAQMLIALDYYLGPLQEITVIGAWPTSRPGV